MVNQEASEQSKLRGKKKRERMEQKRKKKKLGYDRSTSTGLQKKILEGPLQHGSR